MSMKTKGWVAVAFTTTGMDAHHRARKEREQGAKARCRRIPNRGWVVEVRSKAWQD